MVPLVQAGVQRPLHDLIGSWLKVWGGLTPALQLEEGSRSSLRLFSRRLR